MDCTFCGKSIPLGTGKMYVKVDGRVFYFCSNKCEKNMIKLNRIPRNTRWTAEHARQKAGIKAAKNTSKPEAKGKTKPKKEE